MVARSSSVAMGKNGRLVVGFCVQNTKSSPRTDLVVVDSGRELSAQSFGPIRGGVICSGVHHVCSGRWFTT